LREATRDSGAKLDAIVRDVRVERTSTTDQVAEGLRRKILEGHLAPGTDLREVQLAAALGVSRNTVREALRVLMGEGLVRRDMHRGATVARLSEDDVEDIYASRLALEVAAVDAFAGEEEDLAGLSEAMERLERAAQEKDWRALMESDMLFHFLLVRSFGSERMAEFFRGLQSEIRPAFAAWDREWEDPSAWVAQQREILDLLRSGRKSEAVALTRVHLADGKAMAKSAVSQGTTGEAGPEPAGSPDEPEGEGEDGP
jgi:DNA-binding GntR family transcriptional regulator